MIHPLTIFLCGFYAGYRICKAINKQGGNK
jgi:hypothetical protein